MNLTNVPSTQGSPVALVTGGGSGIGAATAEILTQQGWTVVICGRRADALERVAKETGAHVFAADITNPSDVSQLVDHTIERFGRLDGLVLNAGVVRPGAVGELNDSDWTNMVETNLSAPFRLLQASLPHLVKSGGSIVGVASVSAIRASAGIPGYNATKAGLSMLVRSVGVDYGAQGVRANVVCPGWTRSEMADQEMADFGEVEGLNVEQAYQLATALVPLARPAHAKEAASVIAWLLSPSSGYINSAEIPVDGGLSSVDPGTAAFNEKYALKPRS